MKVSAYYNLGLETNHVIARYKDEPLSSNGIRRLLKKVKKQVS